MSDNVVMFTAHTKVVQPIDDETIAMFRTLLARAEAGEIQGALVATVESDGAGSVVSVGTAYGGEGVRQNVHAAAGAIATLQRRFMNERLDD